MELLRYTYRDDYVIQVGSTDIGLSWRKFKVRARQLSPEKYCDYSAASGGTLEVFNADTNELESIDETEWNAARPVFFEDHKYNLTFTFLHAVEEPRIVHPNKDVEAMFNCVHTASGEYIINSNLDFLNQPGHFSLRFIYKNKE